MSEAPQSMIIEAEKESIEELAEVAEAQFKRLVDILNPKNNTLNWLLLALPITLYFNFQHSLQMAFVFSMIAIAPLAFLMGKATEEIALRTGEAVGGLLNATFGNAVEMIIAGMALYAASQNPAVVDTMVTVTQASLIGSILGNLLLVLGLAMLYGGIKHSEQTFSNQSGQMNGALLVLAVVALIVPSAFHYNGGSSDAVMKLSYATALVLLFIYGCSLLFQLKTHVNEFSSGGHGEGHEDPEMSIKDAWVLLILATILVGWMAHILVHSLETTVEKWHLPELFIGVILVPFFGNAAEHFTAVLVAGKDKMDLSIAIAIGSSVQIALFVAPIMVLWGWVLGVPLPLEFGLLETVAAFGSVFITISILADGKTNWLEGAMALACYAILGMAFFFA
ncbi:calcium/proton exchanger [Candidatus Poseidonia alphae]|uniref:calcium/proton exchanger n=1 Tax=Candidatus Poseidonia alphae TaxID=1915863 RepID=UPI00230A957F|nr:calcium/proton exchanger [Candidatus Poseidonia alphae]